MSKKNITYYLLAAVAIYGGIYFYQRYKRKKADESVVSANEAIKIIDEIE